MPARDIPEMLRSRGQLLPTSAVVRSSRPSRKTASVFLGGSRLPRAEGQGPKRRGQGVNPRPRRAFPFRGGGENRRNRAVMHDPGAGVGAYPAGHLKDSLIFRRERAAEDRLVMRDAVAQVAQRRDRLMHIDAPPPRIRKGAVQGRAPQRHLVIELAGRPVRQQPLPESERQLSDDAPRIERPAGAAQRVLRIVDPRPRKRR